MENEASLTDQQKKAIEAVESTFKHRCGWEYSDMEFKYREVFDVAHGTIAYRAKIGMVGDEGTAALLCRKSILIFIGPRGGLSAFGKRGGKVTGARAVQAGLE